MTTTHPITLTPAEIERIRNGATLLVRVMEPQPHPSPYGDGLVGHRDLAGYFAEHVIGGVLAAMHCPFGAPGDRLEPPLAGMWRTFRNDPPPFCLTVTSVRVMRVGEMAEDDASASGMIAVGEWNIENPDHPYESNPWAWCVTFEKD